MIRKYIAKKNVGVVMNVWETLGEVEGEEWFGARENASVKFKLPREKIELEEIPQVPTPPIEFPPGQRPPPVLTPHLRKQRDPKKKTKKARK